MCNPTKQPPRRDMYELTTELAADQGGFFVGEKPKPPRIGGENWREQRPHIIGIYNGNYSPSGIRIGDFPNPWNAVGPDNDALFPTYAEALQWVLQEARK